MVLNTTHGPQEYDPTRPGHTLNTSRLLEEDLTYVDEEPQILAVLPANDWCAVVEGVAVPMPLWVVLDDGSAYGVAVDEGGRVNLSNNVETRPGFDGYAQTTINDKEK
jgi:hypothetical protein